MRKLLIIFPILAALTGCMDTTASSGAGLVADCQFSRYIRGSEQGSTNWQAQIGPTQVTVPGSGQWPASVGRNAAGAVQARFDTNAALETITVSPSGEALWDIRFRNGGALTYLGACQVAP